MLDCSRLRNEVCTIIHIGAYFHYDTSVIAIMRMLRFVHSLGETSDGWIEIWTAAVDKADMLTSRWCHLSVLTNRFQVNLIFHPSTCLLPLSF